MTEEELKAQAEQEAKAKAEQDAKQQAEQKPEGEKKSGPTDAEAKLLQEVMQKKEKLEKLAAENQTLKALADELQNLGGLDALKELVKGKKEAETKELEAKGQWDALRTRMVEEQKKITDALENARKDTEAKLAAALAEIDELTIGGSFSNSKFLTEETVLPPSKARALYAAHFERVDGKLVGYDKPRGAANRTPLVDATGEPVSFEVAIQKIVDADPDVEYIRKAKAKPGAGSNTRKSEPPPKKQELGPQDKIRAGLKGLNVSLNPQ